VAVARGKLAAASERVKRKSCRSLLTNWVDGQEEIPEA
jgi:hypothetical protein